MTPARLRVELRDAVDRRVYRDEQFDHAREADAGRTLRVPPYVALVGQRPGQSGRLQNTWRTPSYMDAAS